MPVIDNLLLKNASFEDIRPQLIDNKRSEVIRKKTSRPSLAQSPSVSCPLLLLGKMVGPRVVHQILQLDIVPKIAWARAIGRAIANRTCVAADQIWAYKATRARARGVRSPSHVRPSRPKDERLLVASTPLSTKLICHGEREEGHLAK